jgi:hypothetical protein
MADAFAPKLSSDVRFNQPIEQPSMVGALAQIGEGFLNSVSRGQRTTGAPKEDPNLALFTQGLERIEAVRDQKGELAAQVEERKLANNFGMAGISFDDDYKAVYEKTTGRPWAGYGEDYEANLARDTLAKPEVQASYIASFAVNPNWTQEQRVEYAIGQQANLAFYRNEIDQAKAKADYQWTTQSEAAFSGAVDTFLNQNFGALVVSGQQGGTVGPQAIANLSAQWGQLKVNLTRPANVSDDQWKSIQDKLNNVDAMLVNLEKASSKGVLLEEITTSIAKSLIKEGQGSTISNISALVALNSPETLLNLSGLGGEVDTFMMEVGKGLNLNLTTQSLFGHITEESGSISGDTDPNAFLTTVPQVVKESVAGKTPQQIYDGLNASGRLTSVVGQNNLQSVDAREQFVTNASTIGAVMMETGSDQFLSNDFLKKLVANPNFIRNVKALDAIDPESATVARTYVRSGLNVELGKQTTNLSSIDNLLEGKGVVWNGSAYVMTPEAAQGGRVIPGMGGFGGVPMSALQENAETIRQAMDRRASIQTIGSALTALQAPVEAGGGDDRLGGGAGSDTLRGAGSGSSSTSAQITYALPEAIAADTEFLDKVVSVSSDLGFDPNDLLRVIDFETAGSFSPKAQPIRKDGTKISSATGLIQFLEKTAKGLGTTTADLANMTAVEQLDYVKRYFEPFKGRIKNFGDVYMAVHWPKGVGKDDSYVMYEAGSDSYNANKGLDTNGDGTVTRGETLARLFSATGKGGNPTAGTPANENTVAAAAGPAVQRAVNNAPSASSPMAATTPAATAEVAPMEATAALPEAIPTEVAATGTQGASELSPAIALDQDVQAFIQEIAGDPDKTYASEAEFVAAQEAGELEPGDTVVVNGEIYVVRKNGLIRRLGTVNS